MQISGQMPFEVAAQSFYELRCIDSIPDRRTAYVSNHTLRGYIQYKRSLGLFFNGMTLDEIRWWNIRSYQEVRASGQPPFVRLRRPQDAKPRRLPDGTILPPKGPTPCPAKPQQVNQEVGFLIHLKQLAGCWSTEDEKYHKDLIEEESEVQRALTLDEQAQWLDVSRSRERWEIVYLYSLVGFDTCCSPNELRALRLGDLRLGYEMISVPWPGSKNPHRHREIVIAEADTMWALNQLIARAQKLGAGQPQSHPTHYLFPQRNKRSRDYDPTKPMTVSGIMKVWNEVRAASGLKWFRPTDTRHTGATRLAERGVPTEIIVARMGHCSDRMRRHYTHIMESAQRSWLRRPPQSVYPVGSVPGFSQPSRFRA